MGKTRRKLYSRRRRQRGKGLGNAICAGALIMALHMAPAAAKDPTFYELAHKYATEGGWENSHNLALFITTAPSKLIPKSVSSLFQYNTDSGEVEATSCAIPAGINEQKVLEQYVLESGKRYKVTIKETLPNEAADIGDGSILIFKAVADGEDDDGNPIVNYEVQRASDVDDPKSAAPDRSYTIPANSVELVPVDKGGRRNRKRKTLRRKK